DQGKTLLHGTLHIYSLGLKKTNNGTQVTCQQIPCQASWRQIGHLDDRSTANRFEKMTFFVSYGLIIDIIVRFNS
ncbi:hypothetical protein, partial [Rhodoferax sp.]|uniref:hypothetical protein n=1 Tax=Rhodoferax sp. TaxID=50421 RepID=UPI00271BCCE8